MSQWRPLRNAIGAMITGLQTMPSIVWFPFAILLFGLDSSAIYFVILMGAIPSIANGIISGIDDVPGVPARGAHARRPWLAPLPLRGDPRRAPVVRRGLSQGWAFAWRGLLAGEIIVSIPEVPALGTQLNQAATNGQSANLLALMLVILLLGMLASFRLLDAGPADPLQARAHRLHRRRLTHRTTSPWATGAPPWHRSSTSCVRRRSRRTSLAGARSLLDHGTAPLCALS